LVLQGQLEADASSEKKLGDRFIGTTKKGIGPTYATKMFRYGIRVGELKNWETFLQKYSILNKKLEEDYHVKVDKEKELNELKHYRDLIVDRNMIIDSATYINQAIKDGKRVLAEGANAIMLDIDHGTYPYVSSSNTGVGGVITGLGIPPKKIETTIGIVKAYTTRVGEGAFPTELKD